MSTGELAILVDEDDNIIKYKDRYKLGPQDRMRMVVVWIENNKGEVLIHKRADSKKVGPGLWENAVGGGVAKGESYEEAAYKELSEELGVDDIKLEFIGKTQFTSHNGPKMCAWYKGRTNKSLNDLSPDEREVQEVKWINADELYADRDKNPQNYMPSSKNWQKLFN